jgi:hypothetical protein
MKSEKIVRKLFLCLFFISFWFCTKAQSNLVPNSSFEDFYSCNNTAIALENYIDYWRGGLGYFNPCMNNNFNVPFNICGHQYARTGNAYCGIYTYAINSYPIRQYIQAPLSTTLTPNKKYLVSFYVSLGDSLHAFNNSIGVYFSEDSITYLNELLNFEPQIKNDTNNQLNDMLNWVKVSDTLIAVGNEKWITIGNFLNDSLSHISPIDSVCSQPNSFGCGAYYYIDDVSVTLIDDTGMEEMLNDPTIKLYPNPARDVLRIEMQNQFTGTITITDALGKVFYQNSTEKNSSQFSIDLREFPPGLYFVSFWNERGGVNKRFVKD